MLCDEPRSIFSIFSPFPRFFFTPKNAINKTDEKNILKKEERKKSVAAFFWGLQHAANVRHFHQKKTRRPLSLAKQEARGSAAWGLEQRNERRASASAR
jgi:hypothetical protein